MQHSSIALAQGRPEHGRAFSVAFFVLVFFGLLLQTSSVRAATEDRIIVRFHGGADAASTEASPLVSRFALREHKRLSQIGAEVLVLPAGADAAATVASLRADKAHVEYAEVDRLISIADAKETLADTSTSATSVGGQTTASLIPNDTYYSSEWYHPLIGSPSAWDLSTGSGVVIAVLDTGVNCTTVTDLVGKCVAGWDVVGNTSNTNDDQGHGTFVSGVAAAAGNNGKQVTGEAFGASIMPVKINQPTTGTAYYSDIINGVLWAADHGAKVVNLSFAGTADPGLAFENAAGYLRQKGAILFQAAGNSGVALTFPNYATIDLIGATDSTDTRASYSNTGAAVDMTAPGSSIYTVGKDNNVYIVSGTSFASPMAAGVAALVLSRNPSLLPWQLENILFANAHDLGAPGRDSSYGWGRVDAGQSVMSALSALPADTTAPDATGFSSWSTDSVSTVTLGWSSVYDNTGPVTLYRVYRNGVAIGTTNTLSFTDSSAPAGTDSYTVRSVDGSGLESSDSAAVSFTMSGAPTPDTTAPSVPANLSATPSATQISLSWSASTDNVGVAGYNVYRNGALLKTVTNTSYTDTAVTAGSTYSYTVQAFDAAGNSSGQSAAASATVPSAPAPDTTAPSIPTGLAATPSATQISLSWTASTDNVGVTGYNVYRNGSLLVIVSGSVVSYTDTAVTAGSTYSYTVQAFDAAGNSSGQSAAASATVPNPPVALTISGVSAAPNSSLRIAKISWSTSIPATGSVLYGTSPSSLTKTALASQLQTSQSVTLSGLSRRTTYYYQVTASASGTTVKSSVFSFRE